MIHSELISTSTLTATFHGFCEQLTGVNPASVVQKGRRPNSKTAYPLSYFKAFNDPQSNTGEVKSLLGMMHFGLLCAGPDIDMVDILGWPHGLRCLTGQATQRGIICAIFTGGGDQWRTALRNAGEGPQAVNAWGVSCYQQFSRHNLDDLFGKLKPNKNARDGGSTGYYLEN